MPRPKKVIRRHLVIDRYNSKAIAVETSEEPGPGPRPGEILISNIPHKQLWELARAKYPDIDSIHSEYLTIIYDIELVP